MMREDDSMRGEKERREQKECAKGTKMSKAIQIQERERKETVDFVAEGVSNHAEHTGALE
jgi:hypothetical protein